MQFVSSSVAVKFYFLDPKIIARKNYTTKQEKMWKTKKKLNNSIFLIFLQKCGLRELESPSSHFFFKLQRMTIQIQQN